MGLMELEKLPDCGDNKIKSSVMAGCFGSQKKLPELRFELRAAVRTDMCGIAVIISV